MRNAEWFRQKQKELKAENEQKIKHDKLVNEQWMRIMDVLNNFEVKETTEFIPIDEELFNENWNKLEDIMGFDVEEDNGGVRLYFSNVDDEVIEDTSIYNIKDENHKNSRIDDIYDKLSRQKSKYDLKQMEENTETEENIDKNTLEDAMNELLKLFCC